MENTLLYFFSTIPQVLAAIIALVFIFVLFKLQSFEKPIDALCQKFAAILGNNVTDSTEWQRLGSGGKFMTNYTAKYFTGISKIMRTICTERAADKKHEGVVSNLRKIADKTEIFERQRQKIIYKTKYLCIIGFTTIIGSLIIIPFAKSIDGKCFLMNIFFVLFIVLTTITLIWVYIIMSSSLKSIE